MKRKLTELKGEIRQFNNNIGAFSSLLSVMDRITGQKIKKTMKDFNTIEQLDLSVELHNCWLHVLLQCTQTILFHSPGNNSMFSH